MDSENSDAYENNVHKTILQPPKRLAGVQFGSCAAMEKALNEFAATQGYGIETKSSYKKRNGHCTVFYNSERGVSYLNRLG